MPRIIALTLTFGLFLSTTQLSVSQQLPSLAEIETKINDRGLDWVISTSPDVHVYRDYVRTAQNTEITIPEELQAIYDELNSQPEPELILDIDIFDWRDSSCVTPVRNQGGCGSCWAFAAVGAFESAILVTDGIEYDLSEQQILSCNNRGSSCAGGSMQHAYDLMRFYGAVSESCMPYQANDNIPCTQTDCEVLAELDSIYMAANNVNAIKNALLDGPVSTVFTVYGDFYGYGGGCYSHEDTDPPNHAVVIVGWDDNMCNGEGAWIIKNSWGSGWGLDGYCYIKYNSSGIGQSTQRPIYYGNRDLAFSFPDGLPVSIDPNDETSVRLEVLPSNANPVPGSAKLHYYIGGFFEIELPLQVVEPNVYNIAFPTFGCGTVIDYYLSAESDHGNVQYYPYGNPHRWANTISASELDIVFQDNFQTDHGWVVENEYVDDGAWERAIPGTYGVYGEPTSDYDGSGYCYVTDNAAGESDLDGGPTKFISPTIDLSQYQNGYISFARWISSFNSGYDDLRAYASDDDGFTWELLDYYKDRGGWTEEKLSLTGELQLTEQMKLQFSVSDRPDNTWTEAAVDAIAIYGGNCAEAPNVSISMIAHEVLETIEAGSSFGFTGVLNGNIDRPWVVDAWVMMDVPGTGMYGPMARAYNIVLGPHYSYVDETLSQNIPVYAPPGNYRYVAYCGEYPDSPIDSAVLEFEVVEGSGSGVNDWTTGGMDLIAANGFGMETLISVENTPNPFNATTRIEYVLSDDSDVRVDIFNLMGQRVATLVDERQSAGIKTVSWDASDYSSGIYFYRLSIDRDVFIKKMTLLK